MGNIHHYTATTRWTGNKGTGTSEYTAYERSHEISIDGKMALPCSSDPAFRGDKSKHNPEDLLLASLSGCHMLWYLHLCAVNNIIILDYVDNARGVMEMMRNGSGQFREATLYPQVVVADSSMIEKANELHHEANKMCFIARSVNFPVHHQPVASAAKKYETN